MVDMEGVTFEDAYPWTTVLLCNAHTWLVYVISAYILLNAHLILAIVYLIAVSVQELRLMKRHCVDCCYHGKRCAFGRGKLSGALFDKGEPGRFACRTTTWKDMLPDMALLVVPLLVGVYLTVVSFSWEILASIIALFLLASVGNALIRGRLSCPRCRHGEIGCPALMLFDKN